MYFEKIRLVNFRNYQDVTCGFSPRINFFIGDNGQGKTNLLEALFILTNGDSFRYCDNSNLIGKFGPESHLQSLIYLNKLNYKLSLKLSDKKKTFSVNDKLSTIGEIKKLCSTIIFSPESLTAIKEGSDHRRQLVDELIVSFNQMNSDLIYEFRKALKARNKILKNFNIGETNRQTTIDLLDSINPIFFKLAIELTMQRLKALKGIANDLNSAMQYITENQSDELTVNYYISDHDALNYSDSELEDLFKKRHSDLAEIELSTGSSLIGPQKHDIVFLYGQNDSRFYCSQGQQRAIILSFKIAQIVYHRKAHGKYPVLMLDDVLSELDKTKKNALIKFLHEINTQIFVTTTDITLPESFSLENLSVLNIKDGHILE